MGFFNIGGISQDEAKILTYLAAYYKVLWINEKNKTEAMPGLEDDDIKLAIQIQLRNFVNDLSSLGRYEKEIQDLSTQTMGLSARIGLERLDQFLNTPKNDVPVTKKNTTIPEKNPKTFGPKSTKKKK